MAAHHELMGGKLHVYKRENSTYWQCSTFLGGKNHRVSTKEDSLAQAKDFAEDWYLELKGKFKRGEVKSGKPSSSPPPNSSTSSKSSPKGSAALSMWRIIAADSKIISSRFSAARHWARSPLAVPKITVCTG